MEHETDLVRFVLLRLRHLKLVEALVAEPPGLVPEPDVVYLVAHIEAVGEIRESRRAPTWRSASGNSEILRPPAGVESQSSVVATDARAPAQ
jgi:hypothetical protein